MKKWTFLLWESLVIIMMMIVIGKAIAQSPYPAQIQVQVLPPYSPFLSAYTQYENSCIIFITTSPNLPPGTLARFHAVFSGDNGVLVATDPGYVPSTPLVLNPGETRQFNGRDLAPYFEQAHIQVSGVNVNQVIIDGRLPEGNYSLCVQLYEYLGTQSLSGPEPGGCCPPFPIVYAMPPNITYPECGSQLIEQLAQNLAFTWSYPVGVMGQLEYTLKIAEHIPLSANPNEVMNSSPTPPLLERTTNMLAYIMTPGDPLLEKGKSYVAQVSVKDIAGQIVFQNNGKGEACPFTVVGDSIIFNVTADPTVPTGGTTLISNTACICYCSPAIDPIKKEGKKWSYVAGGIFSCSGYCSSGMEFTVCEKKDVTHKWRLTGGAGVASIEGKDNGDTLTVSVEGTGSFNIYLNSTLNCSCSSCSNVASLEQDVPTTPTTTDCMISHEWCAGPAIKVDKFGHYPSEEKALNALLPGDLIGFSAYASDNDYLIQHCNCPEGLTSTKFMLPDVVDYTWELVPLYKLHGELVGFPGIKGSANSILYRLPVCNENFPVMDKIILTIKNSGGKAGDEELKIEYLISASVIVTSSTSEHVKITQGLIVVVSERILNNPKDTECKDAPGKDCVVMPLVWEEGSKAGVSEGVITYKLSEIPPDNLSVLQVIAGDGDKLKLTCFHMKDGSFSTEMLPNVSDPMDITWDILSGKGSFPLGNKGPAVLLVQNYTPAESGKSVNVMDIVCFVQDSKKQFFDKDTNLSIKVRPRMQPQAYVGVGDIHYWIWDHGELLEGSKTASSKFKAAGYDVIYDDWATLTSIGLAFKNPACQSILLIGHGTEDGFCTVNGTDYVIPSSVRLWVSEKWGCTSSSRKHVFLRDLQLLGCNMGKMEAAWYENFFNLEQFYAPKSWAFSSAFYSSIVEYINKDLKPLKPRILDY